MARSPDRQIEFNSLMAFFACKTLYSMLCEFSDQLIKQQ